MDVIKAILVDDEPRANSVLKELLLKSTYDIKIMDICEDLVSAVKTIKELEPDVVFLDVQMPNYAGYEIVNFFEKINFEIIFVTAFNKYAIKAFELCAIDYLVKPIKRVRLGEALAKLQSRMEDKNNLEQYQTLLRTIQNSRQNKLVIAEMGNRRIININDIIAIEANGAYTSIHLLNQQKITTSKNLKYYENLLDNDTSFYRVHRSWLINFDYLKSFNRTASILHLEANIEAKISRKHYNEFLERCSNSQHL